MESAHAVRPAAATASARSGSKTSAIHAATAALPMTAATIEAVRLASRPFAAR